MVVFKKKKQLCRGDRRKNQRVPVFHGVFLPMLRHGWYSKVDTKYDYN